MLAVRTRLLSAVGPLALFAALAAPAAAGSPEPTTFEIDAVHSSVGFSIRHLVSRVRGSFGDFGGTIVMLPEKLEMTRGEVGVKTASIDTGNERRDGHLRSPDFFDAEAHPEIRFVITNVRRTGRDSAMVEGDLTMHGATRPVRLRATEIALMEGQRGKLLGFQATGTIDRKEFGIEWNRVLDTGGVALGDEVTIELAVEAREARPPEAPGQ